MSNVMLVGPFGQGDLAAEATASALCATLADHEVVVVSADPAETRARHGVPATGMGVGTLLRRVRRADLVLFAGGSVFTSGRSSGSPDGATVLRDAVAVVAAANISRRRVALLGVGAREVRGTVARGMARWLIEHVDLLVLRDEESAAVLADTGAPTPFWIGADLAWIQLDAVAARRSAGRAEPTVVLALEGEQRRLVEALRPVIARLAGTHSVHVQPGGGRDDGESAEVVRGILGPEVKLLDRPVDLLEEAAAVAAADLVIGTRFDTLLAAGMVGSRFLAVADEPRVAGLARRLRQVAVPLDASPDVLAGAADQALAGPRVTRSAAREQQLEAARSVELMRLLLADGVPEDPSHVAGLRLSDGSGAW